MRVLAVHNLYSSGQPSGENVAFEAECAMLRSNGVDVHIYTRASDELRSWGTLGLAVGAAATAWNPFEARRLRAAVEKLQPDVVHVHNTFPLISPSIFHAIGTRAARVLTLHNYRLFCAAAIPMRDGRICTECLDRRAVRPALLHGCYRNSRIATAPLALNIALTRRLGTWTREVDAFIALTEFQKRKVVEAGLPTQKVHVKGNHYCGYPAVVPIDRRAPWIAYVGRLSDEKGIGNLIEAWNALPTDVSAPRLRIVGDGPLDNALRAAATSPSIEFLGQLAPAEAQRVIADARLLVVPSRCYEGFPMVIREAFALGTPVAVSNVGPLPSIVGEGRCGAIIPTGTPLALMSAILRLWNDSSELARLGTAGRAEFESRYTEESAFVALSAIYGEAMSLNRGRALLPRSSLA